MKNRSVLALTAIFLISMIGIGFAAAFPGMGSQFGNLTDEEVTQFQQEREAMRTAIEDSDFAAWKSLMESRLEAMKAEITEENFNTLVERHQNMEEFRTAMEEARESGDYETMQELREEYGLPERGGMGQHKGSGLRQGMGQENGSGNGLMIHR